MNIGERRILNYSELLMNTVLSFEYQYGFEPIKMTAEQELAAEKIRDYFRSQYWLSLSATFDSSAAAQVS